MYDLPITNWDALLLSSYWRLTGATISDSTRVKYTAMTKIVETVRTRNWNKWLRWKLITPVDEMKKSSLHGIDRGLTISISKWRWSSHLGWLNTVFKHLYFHFCHISDFFFLKAKTWSLIWTTTNVHLFDNLCALQAVTMVTHDKEVERMPLPHLCKIRHFFQCRICFLKVIELKYV